MAPWTSSPALKYLHLHLTLPYSIHVIDRLITTCHLTTIEILILTHGLMSSPTITRTLLKLREEISPHGTLYHLDEKEHVFVIHYTDIPNLHGGLLWRRVLTKLATSSAKSIYVDRETLTWMMHSFELF